MKLITVLLALVVLACSTQGTPIRRDHARILINRPIREEIFGGSSTRVRRSDQPGVKGRPVHNPHPVHQPLQMKVRKGEYVCGNKICKLQPGEVPKACVGCQYPV